MRFHLSLKIGDFIPAVLTILGCGMIGQHCMDTQGRLSCIPTVKKEILMSQQLRSRLL